MRKTLIIYDNTGRIFGTYTGDYTIPEGGINYIETEIPSNQQPISVDVATGKLICEELPPSTMELLQEDVTQLQLALTELYEGLEV